MRFHPQAAEDKLGFDVIRERLDHFVVSRLGQARVAHMRPAGNPDWARNELQRVWELQQAYRFDDPVPLQHVLDIREVIRRLVPEDAFVPTEDLLAIRLVLETTRRMRRYFESRRQKYPAMASTTERITALEELERGISRVVDDEGRLRDDASTELRRIRRALIQRQIQLRETLMNELRRAIGSGFATEEQPTIRNGRMVIPVRSEARRKVQGFVQDVSATGQTVYVEPTSCLDLNNEVRELESEERREIERVLREVASAIRVHLESIQTNIKALAQLDFLQAKAHLANELDAVVPQLNTDGIIDIRKGRNPVLLLRFQRLKEETGVQRDVIPLNLKLGEDYRTLVITGPNAGGKTVAMKTVGLFASMLGYGIPIPVDPLSHFCLFDQVIVDIGDEQSLEEDLSTFSSHVTNLKFMLRHAGPGTLILIDEAGTGTDPAEGGALAQAVLERLTAEGTRTIATTHHGTLKVFAHETEGVENGSMQFDQETLSPTYRFQARIPGSSYAFEIAQRIGLQRDVLSRARNLVGRQKTALEELIATFERRNRDLETRLADAEKNRREAAQERATYEQRLATLKNEQADLKQRALDEAERILEQANAGVERTIREIREAQAEKEATRAARETLDRLRTQITREKKKIVREPAPPRPAPRKEPRRSTPIPEGIQVGDQVILDGGSTIAEVSEIEGRFALITSDAMRLRVSLDRLQRVGGKKKQVVTVRQVQQHGSDLPTLSTRNTIDLRGYRVDEALAEMVPFIDRAVAAGLERVEILHGKGTGALRVSIHDYLSRNPDVAGFEEAPWEQGGAGVTYVTLR